MSNKGQTIADQIWEEVKGKDLNLFALPSQKVESHFAFVQVEPSKLYLSIKDKNATSLLPALENTLGSKYAVELAGRFISVAKI